MAVETEGSHKNDLLLIVAREDGRVLSVADGTLAVFSGEGEANLFLYFAVDEDTWKIKRVSPEELLLMFASEDAEMIALDPSPEMITQHLVELVSMSRSLFLKKFAKQVRGLRLPTASRVVGELGIAN